MFKIAYFGYDLYELKQDLGSGDMLKTKSNIRIPKNDNSFKSIHGALKYICKVLGTAYHKYDWCFEEDVCEKGDAWVLHVIVDKNMKFATEKMIVGFQKDEVELQDLLMNVVVKEVK